MNGYRTESKSESPDPRGMIAEFVGLPARVRCAPYDVGLPSPEAETLLLTIPGLGEREVWIARSGGEAIGRIGASVSAHEPARGAVGFFEVASGHEQAAAPLLEAAERWLAARGVRQVYGPMCINTWFPYRYRTDTSDDRHFSWEPVNPPTYPELFESAGYTRDMSYHSDCLADIRALGAGMTRTFEKSPAAKYSYRPVRIEELRAEVPKLHEISLRSFHGNYLIEPIAIAVFEQLYVAQASKRRSVGCYFAVDAVDGEVGFIISFEDETGQFVIKSMAVVPEHQGKALSFGLVHHTVQAAIERGHEVAIAALMESGNRSEFGNKRSPVGWQHHYALYGKSLATRGS